MAKLYNRVKVTTPSAGTGTLALGAAASDAFLSFAEAGAQNGDLVTYLIEEGDDFELGRGSYATPGETLTRTTVLRSKIGGVAGTTKMALAGAATVAVVAAAEDITNGAPTVQVLTAGSGTYLRPAGCRWIKVRMTGGGGGGAGAGTGAPGAGGTGGASTFGALTANGGLGGSPNTGATAAGGTASGGDVNSQGAPGGAGVAVSAAGVSYGGAGAGSPFGGGPSITSGGGNPGAAGLAKGTGGAGGTAAAHSTWGNGGGAGGYLEKIIAEPAASYAFAVGSGGTSGFAGTGGQAGGAGSAGVIIVEEFYGN